MLINIESLLIFMAIIDDPITDNLRKQQDTFAFTDFYRLCRMPKSRLVHLGSSRVKGSKNQLPQKMCNLFIPRGGCALRMHILRAIRSNETNSHTLMIHLECSKLSPIGSGVRIFFIGIIPLLSGKRMWYWLKCNKIDGKQKVYGNICSHVYDTDIKCIELLRHETESFAAGIFMTHLSSNEQTLLSISQ